MNDIVAKTVICGSGWIIVVLQYVFFRLNTKKEKQKEIKDLKEKLLDTTEKIVKLHNKKETNEKDYLLLKERVMNHLDMQGAKIDKGIRIKISDNLENLLFKLRHNEPYTDTKKLLDKTILSIEFK